MQTLLLIDDDVAHADVFQKAVLQAKDGPFRAEWVRTISEGIGRLIRKDIWAVFLNLSLPDSEGIETYTRLSQVDSDIPTLVLSSAADDETALEAMRLGAKDYILDDHFDTYSVDRAIRNLVERKAVEDTMIMEKERAQVTLNSIGDAVLSTDNTGRIAYLNIVAEKMTGWTRAEAMGKPLAEVFRIIDGGTREASPDPLKSAIEKNKTVGLTPHCILIRRDGYECPIEDSASPIRDRHGIVRGAVIVFHDVSKARELRQEMFHLAQHDTLTNLPNRILLKDRIRQAIAASHRNGSRVAVLYIDLDGFKGINDSLGHDTGDRLLRSVADRLLACVRNCDTVSRIGGDEFIVLLTEVALPNDAGVKAGKILRALTAPYQVDNRSVRVTASIGITTCPDDATDTEALIRNSDLAMYHAKESGRNTYQFFDKEMNARATERQLLEGQLRVALERDELVLHYQPRIDLRSGEINGAEALLRWQHPDRGLIEPPQFMSTAEDCGLMIPIGQWVLLQACTQARTWQNAGTRPIGISVNISSEEFRSEELLHSVLLALAGSGLQPHLLEIELTENVLMQHAEFTVPLLQKLKSIGVRLAIDHFGIGYSTLSNLSQFPIDALKIDRSFVYEIDAAASDSPIISALINMGKSLKHRVIAEGVETAGHLAFLRDHDCDEGQGFYFGRPIPALQFAELIQTGVAVTIRNSLMTSRNAVE